MIASRREVILGILTLFVGTAVVQMNETDPSGNPSSYPFIKPVFAPPAATGPILDAKCNVEQLEEANDSQLYSILHELRETAFFRMFAVDLNARCPLADDFVNRKRPNKKTQPENEQTKEQEPDTTQEQEEAPCEGGMEDLDPHAGPACGVQSEEMPWKSHGFSSLPLPSTTGSLPAQDTVDDEVDSSEQESTHAEGQSASNDDHCTGGLLEGELDEDEPPLCSLTGDDHSGRPTPIKNMLTSALRGIAEQFGWESESQKKTFSWSTQTDPVVGNNAESEACDVGGLPDTFWVDMCSQIQAGDGLKVVNLALNPERNTGYNGTHIWNAIYEENCIAVDREPDAPMCYEERVLYRLLSGLHTSTTLSIAKFYYPPSKRKGREKWEPNPQYFMSKFAANSDHIRNLHFSYVVLLRALRKASSFLYNYEIVAGDIVEDETATILLRRLLDSTILRSCHNVFEAFDESLMFQEGELNEGESLKQNFKGVFHNVSSILDCVQCQQCKLHGKMAMLGYGAALKILFLPNDDMIASSLSRNEIVAFISTLAKMSESVKEVRELTNLYWETTSEGVNMDISSPSWLPGSDSTLTTSSWEAPSTVASVSNTMDPVLVADAAVAAIASLGKTGQISMEWEAELIRLALKRDANLMILAKHYSADLQRFLLHLRSIDGVAGDGSSEGRMLMPTEVLPDAIVVGSGLAGLAATLNILDRGGSVVVIEKEHLLGGNSNKASSGINACCPNNSIYGDSLESFLQDTIKSAGDAVQLDLVDTLVRKSDEGISWLKQRAGVDLSLLAQLGGHAHKRTHRPSNGMAGAEIIFRMQKAVKEYEKVGAVKFIIDTKVTKLLTNSEGHVVGVECESLSGERESPFDLRSDNVVLATGGFAADRSNHSYLAQYRPELLNMPATAGEFSTGDGIGLAEALGAVTVDMDKVQVHPTGWVNPKDPSKKSKVLAAELMRGVGGILINKSGKRFCNELGTRAYVTDTMLSHDPHYAKTKKWDASTDIPTFSLVLSSSAAEEGKKHVDLYMNKGLLTRIQGVAELAAWMGLDVDIVKSTLTKYQQDAIEGRDSFGKASFRGVPQKELDSEVFYAGTVTPVLHYCMGGITIDTSGSVLDANRNPIVGLHAAGEVTGGVHGNNRLGGNSLLECTVYGTIVGKKIPVKSRERAVSPAETHREEVPATREVTMAEVQEHNSPDKCWVALHGTVYDLTDFAEEHPGSPLSVTRLAGTDGTAAFQAAHNEAMLDDFEDVKIGNLKQ